MTVPVQDIKGTTETMLAKFKELAISDSEKLLAAAASPAQRKELAAACGCAPADILGLANRADLARVSGVAGVYSDLLEQAGVDTVKELATRRPDNLLAKLIATNDAAKLTQRPPTAAMVEDWVAQAKGLPPILTY
jgi:predicted flap endonuclease-1-like 5' DNA nuclease